VGGISAFEKTFMVERRLRSGWVPHVAVKKSQSRGRRYLNILLLLGINSGLLRHHVGGLDEYLTMIPLRKLDCCSRKWLSKRTLQQVVKMLDFIT
jgi:hypothetical protein